MIGLLLFVIWILWLLFRRDEERVEELEDEVEELEEEIDELEKGRMLAKAALAKKKKSKAIKALDTAEKEVIATKKKAVKKVTATKQEVEAEATKKVPQKRSSKVTNK